ncbi:protein of unknown function (DUF349) [Cyclonatronum proteinivorum]|uniref:DUF349 domain-containing protein n=1 Tax=Cyclonatronum proteinivorum TaxID=1457365 RepID=A0A345UPJ0_9BACT|nr:DUF349 domain-containing protein [Cyclonatronum proteinivorum]AXJ02392.1 protein of unknown function (DUF349) [Cyclonatronum proteinivorum]
MQTDATNSNNALFENDYCLVSAEGNFILKTNSFFEARTLETGITAENAAEKAAHYAEAFSRFADELREKINALPALLSTEEAEKAKAELKGVLETAQAAGDFDELFATLSTAIEAKQVAPGSDEEKAAAAVTEAPETVEAEAETPAEAEEAAEAQPEAETPSDQTPAASADKKTETGTGTEPQAETESDADESGEVTPEQYYKNLTAKAAALSEIKNTKEASAQYDKLKEEWSAGPAFDHVDYYKLKDKFEAVEKELETRRLEYQKQQQQKRENNLKYRDELLDRIQKIIDSKKWKASGEVNSLKRKFENVKPLPQEGTDVQEARMQELSDTFEAHRVEYIVEMRKKEEENEQGKRLILDKMKLLISGAAEGTPDWDKLDGEMNQLTKDWRKIGRVAKEVEDQLWKEYHQLRDQLIETRLERDAAYREQTEANIRKREALIEKAQALTSAESLAEASREINQLHKKWKQIGATPQKKHDELWDAFKQATDAFNAHRSENSDQIAEEENKNLEAREQLIKQIEKLIEDGAWKGSTKAAEKIFEQWKAIGPVPRRKSNSTWRTFRKLIDTYYKNRREHFKSVRSDQKDNLAQKQEIVDKITTLAEAEDIEAALEEVKQLQEAYKEIGFVPIKQKDKIWDAYRKACDIFFNQLRERGSKGAARSSGNTGGGRSSAPVSETRKITNDLFRLRKEAEEIRNQILNYADTKTYFKPNKKGQKLIDEIQNNIDQAQQKLDQKEAQILELQNRLNDLESGTAE